MDGLEFPIRPAPRPFNPARMDVAFFAGFVRRRAVSVPQAGEADAAYIARALGPAIHTWLDQSGWLGRDSQRTAAQVVALENLPVVIEQWDSFDALFAGEDRVVDPEGRRCDTRLGAAVRDFFSQGGRRCYVVRLGDPWPLGEARVHRLGFRDVLFPVVPPASPVDRASWIGLGHVLGLPEVSFAVLPDLADIFSADQAPIYREEDPAAPEQFIECSEREVPNSAGSLRQIAAPRCDAEGFADWRDFIIRLGNFVADPRNRLREIQLIVALPLPLREQELGHDPAVLVAPPGQRQRVGARRAAEARRAQWAEAAAIQTVFVQLCYPWLRTQTSRRLPEELTAPDGVLAGMLARNALISGTWNSVLREPVTGLTGLVPILDPSEQRHLLPFLPATPMAPRTVRERISLFGMTVNGLRVLSDVTMDDDETYRPANVNRLVSTIVRAARVAGETLTFENNGPALWNKLRNALRSILTALWSKGALDGASANEAFQVVCDRSTMTQNDLDAGRLIAQIEFKPAAPIERIVVVLALSEGGSVTLLATRSRLAQEAAA